MGILKNSSSTGSGSGGDARLREEVADLLAEARAGVHRAHVEVVLLHLRVKLYARSVEAVHLRTQAHTARPTHTSTHARLNCVYEHIWA